VAPNLANVGGSVADLVAGLKQNSRLAEADLTAALAAIGGEN
jgi:hypothetical protein